MGCDGACEASPTAARRADGHCCDGCAEDARRAALNPMLRIVHGGAPRRAAGFVAAPSRGIVAQPAPAPTSASGHVHHHHGRPRVVADVFAVPFGDFLDVMDFSAAQWCLLTPPEKAKLVALFVQANPGAIPDAAAYAAALDAHCGLHRVPVALASSGYAGDARRYPRVPPQTFLEVSGLPCAAWGRLLPAAQAAHIMAFARANPGSIGDPLLFAWMVDRSCARRLGPRASGLLSSGTATWASADADVVSYAFDAEGNSVSLDASGNPIPGTVMSATDEHLPDSAWTGDGSGGGGDGGGGGGLTDAQVRAISNDVSAFISTAGTTIQALINQANATQRAQIAAGVSAQHAADQLALQRATDDTERQRLQDRIATEEAALAAAQGQSAGSGLKTAAVGAAVVGGAALVAHLVGWL
jgi:hypothetical protein